MILIGQYDSPFVRRVGIALTLAGISFIHRPWSVFSDGDKIAPLNPLVRVPTLVLDDGETVVDSHAMIDLIEGMLGPGRALFPQAEPARRCALRVAGLAMGAAEKGVSLFYEHRLHEQVSQVWSQRCRMQMEGALGVLDADRRARPSRYWFGDALGHADIAVGCAFRFLSEAHTGLALPARFEALAHFSAMLEDLPVFRTVS
ncbi:MAG: glutathione S-transferase N-terminal domain-containing protein [Hyphomicrobiales bacterium]|nr:glutathione S-transferase N-terminal domain-containing protein [Hyphomicrobiales bacterium]